MSTKHERAFEELASTLRKFGWPIDDEDNPAEMRRALDAYLRIMREPGPDEVRVRVCVAMARQGAWFAWGQNDVPDELARNEATFDCDDPRVTWIEANVPAWAPPAEVTVEGEVAP